MQRHPQAVTLAAVNKANVNLAFPAIPPKIKAVALAAKSVVLKARKVPYRSRTENRVQMGEVTKVIKVQRARIWT
jgi:hypothetical protein